MPDRLWDVRKERSVAHDSSGKSARGVAGQDLRRFKKQCEKEGLTKDIKKNSYFEKPCERKRRKDRMAEKSREKASGKPPKFVKP